MIANEKALTFLIYKTQTKQIIKEVKREYRDFKKASDRDVLTAVIQQQNVPTFRVLAYEHNFYSNGSVAIFPESIEMAQRIISAKYESNVGARFSLPFSSFVLATPKGLLSNGFQVPSCLVTICSLEEENDEVMTNISKYTGINPIRIQHFNVPGHVTNGSEKIITLIYQDPSDKNSSLYRYLYSHHWSEMLLCKSAEDYHDYVASIDTSIKPAFENSCIEYSLFKLVAGIGVYNSATNGKFLEPGIPRQSSKIECSEHDHPKKKFVLREGKGAKKLSHESPDEHVRSWFFRNLKDQKYYQGKFQHLEPGSRWIFIDSTMVNGNMETYTAVDQNIECPES